MTRDYQPFIIRVDEQIGDDFPVRADFLGATWTAVIPRALPLLNIQEIEQAKLWLERGFIDRDYAKAFGRRLFRTLFQDAIREGFRIAYERAAKKDDGLRVVLTLPQALVDLPWELMYDEDGGHGFLARSTTAPLVRHFEVTTLPHTAPEKSPLRILLVSASPPEYPPISSEQESQKIRERLSRRGIGIFKALRLLVRHLSHSRSLSDFFQRIRHRNLFEIDTLPNATKSSLQRKIVEAQRNSEGYHVVHFIGHGYVDGSGSYLVFESEDNKAELVASDEFAEMLGEPTINLAVLNACQTASATSLFQSVAQATLQRGVPSVIGMQVPILDRTALGFAEEFYGAWAAGQPIESALAYARRLAREETPGAAADWGIPVLFMRPVEGLKLELVPPPLQVPPVVRFLRWSFASLITLIGILSALLAIPSINKQLRTEAPIIKCLIPYRMDHGFNVVVTPFSVLDENQNVAWRNDGYELAEYLYQELKFNFEGLNFQDRYEIRPPAHACRIIGDTNEEREQQAAALADRINADVIVYGVVTDTVGRDLFSPEFFVNHTGFQDGEEVTGQYQLGDSLQIFLPFDADRYSAVDNPALTARTEALSLMTIGLSYYSIDDFENATRYFLDAEDTDGWSKGAGKEYVYLLLGNATNRQASQDKASSSLDISIDYFDKALSIQSDFARAMVGKAGVLYLMALGDPKNENYSQIDFNMLNNAASLYQTALGLKNQPETANIVTKVNFGIGKIEFARALYAWERESERVRHLTEADKEFVMVINDYIDGNIRVSNLAGHAYYFRSLIAFHHRSDIGEAIKFVDSAINLVSPYYQSEYTAWKGELYFKDGQIEDAIALYQDAINIAKFYTNEEQEERFSQRLYELLEEQKNAQVNP